MLEILVLLKNFLTNILTNSCPDRSFFPLRLICITVNLLYGHAMNTSLEIIVFQWSDMLTDYARIYVGHFNFKSVNIFFITDNKNIVKVFVSRTKVW